MANPQFGHRHGNQAGYQSDQGCQVMNLDKKALDQRKMVWHRSGRRAFALQSGINSLAEPRVQQRPLFMQWHRHDHHV
jgi:hypothetical protein